MQFYAKSRPELVTDLLGTPLAEFEAETTKGIPDFYCQLVKYPETANSLEQWARRFELTWNGETAPWVIDAAIMKLKERRYSKAPPNASAWQLPFSLRQEYPSPDSGYVSLSDGEAPPEPFRIGFEIDPWDKPGGESVSAFRKRFNAVSKQCREEHIDEILAQQWTTRVPVTQPYLEGLGMWKAGLSFPAIQRQLAAKGFHIGHQKGAERDVAALMRGMDRAAQFIRIDRPRP